MDESGSFSPESPYEEAADMEAQEAYNSKLDMRLGKLSRGRLRNHPLPSEREFQYSGVVSLIDSRITHSVLEHTRHAVVAQELTVNASFPQATSWQSEVFLAIASMNEKLDLICLNQHDQVQVTEEGPGRLLTLMRDLNQDLQDSIRGIQSTLHAMQKKACGIEDLRELSLFLNHQLLESENRTRELQHSHVRLTNDVKNEVAFSRPEFDVLLGRFDGNMRTALQTQTYNTACMLREDIILLTQKLHEAERRLQDQLLVNAAHTNQVANNLADQAQDDARSIAEIREALARLDIGAESQPPVERSDPMTEERLAEMLQANALLMKTEDILRCHICDFRSLLDEGEREDRSPNRICDLVGAFLGKLERGLDRPYSMDEATVL